MPSGNGIVVASERGIGGGPFAASAKEIKRRKGQKTNKKDPHITSPLRRNM